MRDGWKNLKTRGERLRWARRGKFPKSAKAAAESLGIPVSTYNSYERAEYPGGRDYDSDQAAQFGRRFGVSDHWLSTGRGTPSGALPQMPIDYRSEDVSAAMDTSARSAPARLAKPPAAQPPVPILSWVSAGRLTDVDSEVPEGKLDRAFVEELGRGDFFATRVDGDSMNLIAPNRAIVIVNRKEQQLISGRCYIFSIKGKATFKEYQKGSPAFLLPRSTNQEHRPEQIVRKDDVAVVGRVRRVISDL